MEDSHLEFTRPEYFDSFKEKILKFHEDPRKRVFFLIGEVGTGKTSLIKAALKDLNLTQYTPVDMYGATSLKEAYLRLLVNRTSKLVLESYFGFIVYFVLFYFIINFVLACLNVTELTFPLYSSFVSSILIGLFVSIFATNSDDVLFRILSKLEVFQNRESYLIDDLDRTNLSLEASFGFIFNLKNNFRKKMIVTYGSSEGSKIIDTVLKFENSDFFILEPNAEVNLAILQRLWAENPVTGSNIDYLDFLSPRELKNIVLSTFDPDNTKRSILFCHRIHHAIFKKFNFDVTSSQHDFFNFYNSNSQFVFSPGQECELNRDKRKIITDILSSMNFYFNTTPGSNVGTLSEAFKQPKMLPFEVDRFVNVFTLKP